jgi:hypothetical protein
MPEKIELNHFRQFGEIIEDSIQFFKQNWKPLLKAYFTICGFFLLASLLVSVFNQVETEQHKAAGESAFTFTYFAALTFEFLNFLAITLTTLSYISIYKVKEDGAPTVEEVWSYFKYYFFRTLGSYIALGAFICAATLCCILPGVYLSVVFALVFPVMIIEDTTLGYAFNRSFQLIKKNWWSMFGVIAVTEILLAAAIIAIIAPVMIVVFASSFITNVSNTSLYTYTVIIVSHLFQFLYILPIIGVTLAYFSYAEQKDDGTLLQRIMMLGKNNTETDQQPTEEY